MGRASGRAGSRTGGRARVSRLGSVTVLFGVIGGRSFSVGLVFG